jgi:hypothetical protein
MTVTVKIMGKSAQVLEDFTGTTVQDVISFLGLEGTYTANLTGSPATMTSSLSNGAYLVLSPAVKGA